ncbi:hypothetical protein [Empedobacter sp.]|uniref:capsular polysaccharide export protein, LipB/KpsS family n=1 Tax=Empedobacter sp. TaxID=1927715 RepID=UPI0028AD911B|nr:hypothetical protein [Empedobacter sp.]
MEANAISVLLDKSLKILENNKDEVVFVTCSGECRPCDSNAESSKIRCLECRYSSNLALKLINNPKIKHKELNSYLNEKISEDNRKLEFNFNDADDLKSVKYKNLNIGLGVVSSYVSLTRNLNPSFQGETGSFIQKSLKSAALLIDLFEVIIKEEIPDKIIIFNGRYNSMRPLFELSIFRNIEIEVLECTFSNSHNEQNSVSFKNTLPHDIDNNNVIIQDYWNNYFDKSTRENTASQFFFNRRNGVVASDKIYISSQLKNKLPQEWNKNKRNFVIFNSSEDEFFSVGDIFDKYKIFDSQIDGIKYLCENSLKDEEIHFYLRIHPNLCGLDFKYHKDLMNLNYKNLTIINADSPISTYSLIDKCEKVFVFGSTIGVEANFWGKPVVLLGGAFYIHLNVAYYTNNLIELNGFVANNLTPKPIIGALKYALFLFGKRGEKGKYISYNLQMYKVFGKTISIPVFFLKKNKYNYLFTSFLFRIINLPYHLNFKKNILPKLKKEKL